MDKLESPLLHFREMEELAEALRALPAQICDHSYSYESFGSWATVIRCKGVRLRLVFEGRDHEYRLERSPSRKPPDEWCETGWRRIAEPDAGLPVVVITRALEELAG